MANKLINEAHGRDKKTSVQTSTPRAIMWGGDSRGPML